jgi:hypothetical protein
MAKIIFLDAQALACSGDGGINLARIGLGLRCWRQGQSETSGISSLVIGVPSTPHGSCTEYGRLGFLTGLRGIDAAEVAGCSILPNGHVDHAEVRFIGDR